MPEDYEERLTEMFPQAFRHLRLFALDPYDLTLSKLERNIQRDRADVRYLSGTYRFAPRSCTATYSARFLSIRRSGISHMIATIM